MSLFSVCLWRLIGLLTLKTGQKVIAKKKKRQQPLLKPNDAKCQRTKDVGAILRLTCKMFNYIAVILGSISCEVDLSLSNSSAESLWNTTSFLGSPRREGEEK